MTKEILRDKSVDWIESDHDGLKLFCWAVIIIAALYFGPVVVRILAR